MVKRSSKVLRRFVDDEDGAAIVEFALVVVVLFTIIFGLIEGGLMVRARNAVESAADDAARRGSIAGNDPLADWMILQQIRTRGVITAATINFVVIYRADDGSQPPTEGCRLGTAEADECNVYSRADFDLSSTAFGCLTAALDDNWCPADRLSGSTSFDYLGVWVDATHNGLLGIWNDFDIDLIGNSALPLEGGDIS